ncbi:MAG: SgcJ/EcaC family oxidoreductase [Deltaproteobacteria bacterium]|nr:MAG: SgcJ/EcaC family oxidoreductase [Deltaproteobacteria bacterium]TMB44971.1 MAG: SgcJ/EcaC family oxidoreductase [Deltaproteobacteria bacterium]
MFRAMTTQALIALVCVLPAVALADLAGDVKAHEEAFARACVAGDVAAVVALYADDARLVWPGAGEEGRGKADVERMVTTFCKNTKDLKLTLTGVDAVPLDDAHVATVAHWESSATAPGGTRVSAKVRSTEVLVKSGGAWRYLVDHASVGQPPPRPAPRRARKAP